MHGTMNLKKKKTVRSINDPKRSELKHVWIIKMKKRNLDYYATQDKLRFFCCSCDKFLIIKPTRFTISHIYFWIETLHVSDSSSVHHQEFFTVHAAMVYVIRFVDSLQAGSGFQPDPARKLSENLYDIYHCCVYSKKKLLMMDRGTIRNM